MDKKRLEERLKTYESLFNEKTNQLQQLENAKQQLMNEVLELNGQIKLTKELIAEVSIKK